MVGEFIFIKLIGIYKKVNIVVHIISELVYLSFLLCYEITTPKSQFLHKQCFILCSCDTVHIALLLIFFILGSRLKAYPCCFTNGRIYLFLVLCVSVCDIFIHLSCDGHIGCLHILTIVNNTAINIRMHTSLQ